MGRLIAMSDLHGCLKQFVELLREIKLTKEDTLVLLGDYIDRGPNSAQLVEVLINLKRNFPNTVMLKGNHEQLFLNYLYGVDMPSFLYNGGRQTLESYKDQDGNTVIPKEHVYFIKSLPLTFETEDYFFCHAGVNPQNPLNEQTEEDLLWIRYDFLCDDTRYGKIIIHGHTPYFQPDEKVNRIGIDTGGVFGDKFTAADLTDVTNIKYTFVNGLNVPKPLYL